MDAVLTQGGCGGGAVRARIVVEPLDGREPVVLENATVRVTYSISDDGYGALPPTEIVAVEARPFVPADSPADSTAA